MVLSVPDEQSLVRIEMKLRKAGIGHLAIHEPDDPWNGQMTAIGLVPLADRSVTKRILAGLPLLGRERLAMAG